MLTYNHQEAGFTLISYLIALSLFIFILPLLTKTFIILQPASQNERLAIEHFYTYLYEDLVEALEINIKNNEEIEIKVRDRENTERFGRIYKTKSNNIVRSVRGGHEIYIRDIKNVSFKETSQGLLVYIESLKGNMYEKTIVYEK